MRCLFTDECTIPAEFVLSSKRQTALITGTQSIVYSTKTFMCAEHMRKHLKEVHEQGEVLYIDKVK